MLFTIEDKIACLEREIKIRQRVYPGRIATRRMTSKLAYREIETMKQILDDYQRQLADSDLFTRMAVDIGPGGGLM